MEKTDGVKKKSEKKSEKWIACQKETRTKIKKKKSEKAQRAYPRRLEKLIFFKKNVTRNREAIAPKKVEHP